MCGYCIEGSVTLAFVESEDINLEDNWLPVYLQETKDLAATINRTLSFGRFENAIGIAFCRLYRQFIQSGFNDGYQHLEAVYGLSTLVEFFQERRESQSAEIWQTLGNPVLYQDQREWGRFISNRNELTEASEKLLWSYYGFWLADQEDEAVQPLPKITSIGQKYQVDYPPSRDRAKFNAQFPAIFFALSVLANYKPDSNAIIRIALKNPETPDFTGNDLWLQRISFIACLKHYGFEFIAYHFKHIRYELLAYALLKGCINDNNIYQLTELITTYGQNGIVCISANDLLEMVERYKRRKIHC